MWIFYFDSLVNTWESMVDLFFLFIGMASIVYQVHVRAKEGRKPFSREIYFWSLIIAPTWVMLGLVDTIRPSLVELNFAPISLIVLVLSVIPMWFSSVVAGRFIATHLYMVIYGVVKAFGLAEYNATEGNKI